MENECSFTGDSSDSTLPPLSASDRLRNAARQGLEDAKKAAEKTLPRIKAAAAEAGYWTAYGAAFAVALHWHLVKNLTPEVLKNGGRDGMQAGKDVADHVTARMSRPAGAPAALLSPGFKQSASDQV